MATDLDIARAARAMVGVRWRPYGRSAAAGVDCGGLVLAVLRAVGKQMQDLRGYDPGYPQAAMLWQACREQLQEVHFADCGPGRIGLCRWENGDAAHFLVMVDAHEIVHCDARYRRVVCQPAGDLARTLLGAFRVPGIAYGGPWQSSQ